MCATIDSSALQKGGKHLFCFFSLPENLRIQFKEIRQEEKQEVAYAVSRNRNVLPEVIIAGNCIVKAGNN